MGSPLSPTFPDFYMLELENKTFEEDNTFNPIFYVKYINGTFSIFSNSADILQFINLNRLSCFKFTFVMSLNNGTNSVEIENKLK